MKNLFTYPSNSSTGYINPTYYAATANATQIESGGKYFIKTVGTTDFTNLGAASNTVGLFFTANSTTPTGSGTVYIATTGMVGKFLALRSGEYKAFPITYWGSTADNTILENCSKFKNYWDDLKYGTNLSIFDFYSHPMTVFDKSPYNVTVTSKQGQVDSSGNPIWQLVHNTATHFADNDQVDVTVDPSGASQTAFYIDKIDNNNIKLYTGSGPATPYANGLLTTETREKAVFIRKATGMQAIFALNSGKTAPTDPFSAYDDSTPARLSFVETDGTTGGNPFNQTGAGGGAGGGSDRTTSIVTQQDLYGTKNALTAQQSYTIKTLDLFTNTGKSSHPTHTETYSATFTKTFTNSTGSPVDTIVTNGIAIGSGNAGASGFSFSAGTEANIANLKNAVAHEDGSMGFGLARVTISGGSALGSSGASGVNIPTSDDFDDLWYVNYDNDSGGGDDTMTISKKVNDMSTTYNGARTIAASGGTATVTIKIIDPAQARGVGGQACFMVAPNETVSTGVAKRIGGTVTVNKHFIGGKTDILGPGNQTYSYKNTSNATAYGARFSGTYYETADAGTPGTSQSLTSDKTPTFPINVDGSGRLTGYGTLGTITDKVGGVWDNGNDVVLPITSLADTYSPRTPSTVETDETFDTDDYWVDPAFPEGHQTDKTFPLDIIPARATITYVQPSTTNITQSGKKFVRSSQFARYKLQVEYAPMGVDDFRKIQKCVLAAQGQSQPFYFPLKYSDGTYILMSDGTPKGEAGTEIINVTKLADRSAGQSIFTVGGFSQNESDALLDGEHIILGNNPNGNLAMVVSGHDANNFGEVKFRISHPTSQQAGFGTKFYKNPTHAPVTLSADEFEYNVDEQGLYYVTVNFDLDEFK